MGAVSAVDCSGAVVAVSGSCPVDAGRGCGVGPGGVGLFGCRGGVLAGVLSLDGVVVAVVLVGGHGACCGSYETGSSRSGEPRLVGGELIQIGPFDLPLTYPVGQKVTQRISSSPRG